MKRWTPRGGHHEQNQVVKISRGVSESRYRVGRFRLALTTIKIAIMAPLHM